MPIQFLEISRLAGGDPFQLLAPSSTDYFPFSLVSTRVAALDLRELTFRNFPSNSALRFNRMAARIGT
jgi:hypothetical protein